MISDKKYIKIYFSYSEYCISITTLKHILPAIVKHRFYFFSRQIPVFIRVLFNKNESDFIDWITHNLTWEDIKKYAKKLHGKTLEFDYENELSLAVFDIIEKNHT